MMDFDNPTTTTTTATATATTTEEDEEYWNIMMHVLDVENDPLDYVSVVQTTTTTTTTTTPTNGGYNGQYSSTIPPPLPPVPTATEEPTSVLKRRRSITMTEDPVVEQGYLEMIAGPAAAAPPPPPPPGTTMTRSSGTGTGTGTTTVPPQQRLQQYHHKRHSSQPAAMNSTGSCGVNLYYADHPPIPNKMNTNTMIHHHHQQQQQEHHPRSHKRHNSTSMVDAPSYIFYDTTTRMMTTATTNPVAAATTTNTTTTTSSSSALSSTTTPTPLHSISPEISAQPSNHNSIPNMMDVPPPLATEMTMATMTTKLTKYRPLQALQLVPTPSNKQEEAAYRSSSIESSSNTDQQISFQMMVDAPALPLPTPSPAETTTMSSVPLLLAPRQQQQQGGYDNQNSIQMGGYDNQNSIQMMMVEEEAPSASEMTTISMPLNNFPQQGNVFSSSEAVATAAAVVATANTTVTSQQQQQLATTTSTVATHMQMPMSISPEDRTIQPYDYRNNNDSVPIMGPPPPTLETPTMMMSIPMRTTPYQQVNTNVATTMATDCIDESFVFPPPQQQQPPPVSTISPIIPLLPTTTDNGNDQWNEHFQQLVAYKNLHGHCCVPTTNANNTTTSTNGKKQTKKVKKNKKKKKKKKKNSKGSTNSDDDEEEEDTVLPPSPPSYYALTQWVKRQRYQYRLRQLGKSSTMTIERQGALDQLGFLWDLEDAMWEEKWLELIEYQKQYGSCQLPPLNDPTHPELAAWAQRQQEYFLVYCNDDDDDDDGDRYDEVGHDENKDSNFEDSSSSSEGIVTTTTATTTSKMTLNPDQILKLAQVGFVVPNRSWNTTSSNNIQYHDQHQDENTAANQDVVMVYTSNLSGVGPSLDWSTVASVPQEQSQSYQHHQQPPCTTY